ncbi:Venom prothrombin activator oscutarin-C non-catalytic subunit [Exaiptasia diaphana]|nr:Venom prothrombin activator oscutarin-C non-catalytic subunit [Exaiptasia diaphana]
MSLSVAMGGKYLPCGNADDFRNECTSALGMKSGLIPDSNISASSEWDNNHRAENARLDFVPQAGRTRGAWSAKINNQNQWLQVDFGAELKLTQVATQGRFDYDQWVTRYAISYSRDGIFWNKYKKELEGNRDQSSKVTNALCEEIYARFVRVHPIEWHNHISMRVELYGCKSGITISPIQCRRTLGMESKAIPDSRMRASSIWDLNHGADRSRLNTVRQGNKRGAWSARHNNVGQWIEVAFPQAVKITGIATQGRQDVFEGNTDRHTVVSHKLNSPIIALLIRFHPKCWNRHISMRVGLFGCTKGFESPKQICNVTLGLESGLILDSQLSASSEWNRAHRAANARLNFVPEAGRTGAWSARHNNLHQWLKIDFGRIAKINKLATQGRSDSDQWVTRYTLSYSRYGILWDRYHKVM